MVDLCIKCKKRPQTVNYRRGNKTYYRKVCFTCMKANEKNAKLPAQLLARSGYQKKTKCDRCGFTARHKEQMSIAYLDGSNLNVSRGNLRSVCSNCKIEMERLGSNWDIIADY